MINRLCLHLGNFMLNSCDVLKPELASYFFMFKCCNLGDKNKDCGRGRRGEMRGEKVERRKEKNVFQYHST